MARNVRHVVRRWQASLGPAAARRLETVQVSAVLLVLLTLFFHRAVIGGQKLVPADIAFGDPVFAGEAPEGFSGPHNVLLYDQAYQFYPWRVMVVQAVRQGRFPLWNPYVYCGTPLLAEDQPAVMYPLNVLSYALPAADTFLFTAIARLWIAGLGTYWLVRSLGVGKVGALVGGITFAFSGFMVVWLGHPHTNVAAWLPAYFLTLEWLSRGVNARHVVLLAAVVGLQLTGGHAETTLYCLTAGTLYYLYRVASQGGFAGSDGQSENTSPRWHRGFIALSALAVGTALGFGLAAAHLLPLWDWLQQSAEWHLRTGAGSLSASGLGPLYWAAGLATTVLPNLFGNPTWAGDYRSLIPGGNYVEQTAYLGVLGLSLAAMAVGGHLWERLRPAARPGCTLKEEQRTALFLGAMGLAALGASLRLPLLDVVNRAAVYSMAAYGRWRLVYTLCGAVLAGMGMDELLRAESRRKAARRLSAILAATAALGALMVILAPHALRAVAARAATRQARQLLEEGIRRGFRADNVALYWPVLLAAASALLLWFCSARRRSVATGEGNTPRSRAWPRSRMLLPTLLVCLVVVDLFSMGMGYHTTVREELIFPQTPILTRIKQDPELFRVAATHVDLMPNSGALHDLYDVRGLDFPTARYRELMLAMGGHEWLGYGLLLSTQLDLRLLGMLNVKYVISSAALASESGAELELLESEDAIRLYLNNEVLPRAMVVEEVRLAQSPSQALEILVSPSFDPGSQVILEVADPRAFLAAGRVDHSRAGDGSGTMAAHITAYEPNRVVIEAETPRLSFLFVSDSYDPGWRASVDGVNSPVLRANYAFRAVQLPPGKHVVSFVYDPTSFRSGVAISLATMGCLGLAAVQGAAKTRRPIGDAPAA